MRDKYYSQRNALPETGDTDSTSTQRLNDADYAEKMKARYERFAQHKSVAKTEEAFVVTPTKGSQHLRKLLPFMLQAQQVLQRIPVAVIAIVVGLVTLLVQGYRLSAAPDILADEFSYLGVAINAARGFGLVVDNKPFLYHPPAFFLIEATYLKLAGLTNTDLLTAVFSVRYLNVFFSAVTASVLLLFGRKLHSVKAGLLMAALFLMDAYVQRINRRNMLETIAMLCVLLGIYIFFTYRQRLNKWQWLGSGIAFGVAVLTKEGMFIYLFALLAVVAWMRRTQLVDAVRVVAIACLMYLSYPLWEIAIGQWSRYWDFKSSEVYEVVASAGRLLPFCPSSICNKQVAAYAPKRISVSNFQLLLGQYGMSYLLIALAGIFTIILFLRFRPLVEARYLCAWSVFSFGFGIIFGRISDQYLYYLIVPVILVDGYFFVILFESFRYHHRWLRIALALFISLLLIYNTNVWITYYVQGSDNAYTKIVTYVKTHVPPGEPIVLSDDAAYFLLSPTYHIHYDRDVRSIISYNDHYFIVSSKDQWFGYNDTTSQFYDWVLHNSQPLLVVQETTFWTIGLYYIKDPGIITPPNPSSNPSVIMAKSYLGTLYNIPEDLTTKMSLTGIQQSQGTIRGNFTGFQSNGLQVNEPFSGIIDAQRHIHFIVSEYGGHIILSFEGKVQADGTLSGSYCNLDQNGQCAGEYGIWSIAPASHNVGAHPVESSYPTQSTAQPTTNSTYSLDKKETITT